MQHDLTRVHVVVVALLWQEMKQLYHDGLIAHFSSVYNHMDFCMLKFYLASLTLRFTTYLKVSISRSLQG